MARPQGGPPDGAASPLPPFLRIPPEIRNQMYLYSQSEIILVGIGVRYKATNLLQTCKQIRQEALKFTYASCRCIILDVEPKHIKNTTAWLRSQGPEKLSAVPALRISFDGSVVPTAQEKSVLHRASRQSHRERVLEGMKEQYRVLGKDLVEDLVQAGLSPSSATVCYRSGWKGRFPTVQDLLIEILEGAVNCALFPYVAAKVETNELALSESVHTVLHI